jgi:hypothetical protein
MDNYLDLSKFKTSSIGTNVESHVDALQINFEFTWIGWMFITLIGTTQTPTKITFICKKTEEVFEVLEDKKMIKYYMLLCRK